MASVLCEVAGNSASRDESFPGIWGLCNVLGHVFLVKCLVHTRYGAWAGNHLHYRKTEKSPWGGVLIWIGGKTSLSVRLIIFKNPVSESRRECIFDAGFERFSYNLFEC